MRSDPDELRVKLSRKPKAACPDCGMSSPAMAVVPLHRGDCPRLRPLDDFRNPSPEALERPETADRFRSGASVHKVEDDGSQAVREGDEG